MNPYHLSIVPRFRQFFKALADKNLPDWSFIVNAIGWFLSLLMIAINLHAQGGANSTIFLVIHIVFLFRLAKDILKALPPPVELLLILFLLFLVPMNWNFSILSGAPAGPAPSLATLMAHIILLGLLTLLFSLILVQNNDGKRGTIFWFGFLGLLSLYFLQEKNNYLILLYQIFLFFSLLQKTRWLEALTKMECWIYLVLTTFLLNRLVVYNPLVDYSGQDNFWYALPYYFYLLPKLYLLAIVVKIPIVLIYNHAQLARKLKISGLFQSTFPQLIQFILLISIFYVFISGFQARNLRTAMTAELDKIVTGSAGPAVQYFKLDATRPDIQIENYRPVHPKELTGTGVIGLTPVSVPPESDSLRPDYFLFFQSSQNQPLLYLIKLDSIFLKTIAGNLHYLTGTYLWSAKLTPGKWSRNLYQSDFFSEGNFKIKIFPFAFIPHAETKLAEIGLEDEKTESDSDWLNLEFIGHRQVILGRLFLPIWSETSDAGADLWMLDVILDLYPGKLGSGVTQVILVLVFLYLLLNSIVIQRVIKFGEQINRMIVQKFGQLKSGIHEISAGNLDYKIHIEGEDEFVELADRFNQMGDRLKQSIAEMREKERMQFELQSAREVQLGLLPAQLPEIPGYKLAAALETANEVSGDFYDIFALENNRFLFTIGDVSGKGSSAAFYMAQCLSLIRFSRQFTSDPFEIAARLNSYFATTGTDRQIFITAIIGLLDLNDHLIQFIRAGHTEPILISPGESPKIKILKARGLGIGLAKSTSLFEKSTRLTRLSLQPGDTLLLYTDGVVEANRPTTTAAENQPDNLVIFGEERLLALLKQHHNLAPQGLVQAIEHELALFYDGFPRIDDHTLFAIQRSE